MDVTPDAPAGDDLDLSPRTTPESGATGRGPRTRSRWPGIAVLVAVLVVGGFVVSQALGDAALFFRNADEAVTQRQELGDTRFRLQGLVVPDTTEGTGNGDTGLVTFDVTFNDVIVPVEHSGDAPELFQDNIPVVLEGRWSDTGPDAVFLSDRMLVKHDETYDADNPDRLIDADNGGDERATSLGSETRTRASTRPTSSLALS